MCANMAWNQSNLLTMLSTSGCIPPSSIGYSPRQTPWRTTQYHDCFSGKNGISHFPKRFSIHPQCQRRTGILSPQCWTRCTKSSPSTETHSSQHYHRNVVPSPCQSVPTKSEPILTNTSMEQHLLDQHLQGPSSMHQRKNHTTWPMDPTDLPCAWPVHYGCHTASQPNTHELKILNNIQNLLADQHPLWHNESHQNSLTIQMPTSCTHLLKQLTAFKSQLEYIAMATTCNSQSGQLVPMVTHHSKHLFHIKQHQACSTFWFLDHTLWPQVCVDLASMPHHLPTLSPTRPNMGGIQTIQPPMHMCPISQRSRTCKSQPGTTKPSHSQTYSTWSTDNSHNSKHTNNDTPNRNHTFIPHSKADSTKPDLGQEPMALHLTTWQPIQTPQNTWSGPNHLSCKQYICQLLWTSHYCMDHSLMHKTVVGRRYCPRTCWWSLLQPCQGVWCSHCPQLLASVCYALPNHVCCLAMHLCVLWHVIAQINSYQYQPVNPNHTLFDKFGLYHAIHLLHQSLPSLLIKYIHVLSHQDKQKSNTPLPLKAWLNFECDAAVTKLHTQLQPTQYPKQHPLIPTAHPYLVIWGQHVIWQVKQNLQDAYTQPAYTTYLTKKYKWQPCTHWTITWHMLHIALNCFTAPKQQTLHKFLHGWLPLQTCPQVTNTLAEKLCPSCKQQLKDMRHFLSCQHNLCKPAIHKLQQQLQTLHQKHAANPNLYQLLWQGLTVTILQHKLPNPHDHYPPQYIQIFEAQQRIGWIHLLQGCLTMLWVRTTE